MFSGRQHPHFTLAQVFDALNLISTLTLTRERVPMAYAAYTAASPCHRRGIPLLQGISRTALILDWMLTVGLLTSGRVGIRALSDYLVSQRQTGLRTLIARAGGEGARLAVALRERPELGYCPVGFVAPARL